MSNAENDNVPAFDINAEARAHGGYLNLPQREGEPDTAYRDRISGVLRANGQIIEAHEVRTGRRYDDPDQGEMGPMTGIIGALAQALNGKEYSPRDGVSQVGDDLAVGFITEHPRDDSHIAAMFDTFGPGLGMEILDAFRPKD